MYEGGDEKNGDEKNRETFGVLDVVLNLSISTSSLLLRKLLMMCHFLPL